MVCFPDQGIREINIELLLRHVGGFLDNLLSEKKENRLKTVRHKMSKKISFIVHHFQCQTQFFKVAIHRSSK